MRSRAPSLLRTSALLASAAVVALVALLVTVLATRFTKEKPETEALEVARARDRAEAAAAGLSERLLNELTKALEKGGPVSAVRVCSEIAQELTQALANEKNVVLKRTSLRTRNPANAPDDFERAWLERAEAALAAGSSPERVYEVQAAPGGGLELRHLRPIIFPGGVCSQCHGLPEEIDPGVRDLLRQRYPEDRATGFRPGDLRGAISVRLALPKAAASR